MLLYKCNMCGNSIKKLFVGKDPVPGFLSCECSGIMEKQIPDFSTSSIEIVDTGFMAKRVELRKDGIAKAREKGDNYIKEMSDRERIIKKDEN